MEKKSNKQNRQNIRRGKIGKVAKSKDSLHIVFIAMLLMIAEILHQLRTVVYPITYSGVLPLVPNSDARMHYRDVIFKKTCHVTNFGKNGLTYKLLLVGKSLYQPHGRLTPDPLR